MFIDVECKTTCMQLQRLLARESRNIGKQSTHLNQNCFVKTWNMKPRGFIFARLPLNKTKRIDSEGVYLFHRHRQALIYN